MTKTDWFGTLGIDPDKLNDPDSQDFENMRIASSIHEKLTGILYVLHLHGKSTYDPLRVKDVLNEQPSPINIKDLPLALPEEMNLEDFVLSDKSVREHAATNPNVACSLHRELTIALSRLHDEGLIKYNPTPNGEKFNEVTDLIQQLNIWLSGGGEGYRKPSEKVVQAFCDLGNHLGLYFKLLSRAGLIKQDGNRDSPSGKGFS